MPVSLENRHRVGPASSWVQNRNFRLGAQPSSEPFSTLLIDAQHCPAEQQAYQRNVRRLNNTEAVQHLSQVEIAFDPAVESLTIHQIGIWRGGQYVERLREDQIRVIQREQHLERQIYDGSLSALFLLEDVRVGDAVDFSYTLTRDHPAYQNHLSFLKIGNSPYAVEDWHYQLVGVTQDTVDFHCKGGMPNPQVDETPSYGETWHWHCQDLRKGHQELGAPIWHISQPFLQVTGFRSWSAVLDWIENLWTMQEVPDDVSAFVNDLVPSRSEDGLAEVETLVRFVQNDVRYLGIESGIGSLSPSPPDVILRRRFGDCKDKSLLLVTMLRALGIQASCVLVHSILRAHIADFLPSPQLFDHVVTRITLNDGRAIWVDATNAHSRGPLLSRPPLHFAKGLELGQGASSLIDIPRPETTHSLLRVREDYHLSASNTGTQLTLKTKASGIEAERIRAQREAMGHDAFTRLYTQSIQETFKDARRTGEFVFKDIEEENEIEIQEQYTLPNFKKRSDDGRVQFVSLSPSAMRGRLSVADADYPEKAPLELIYPTRIRNRIRVHTPWRIPVSPEKSVVENDYFRFEAASMSLESGGVEVRFGYDALADHVPSVSMKKYKLDFERVGNSIQYQLIVNRPSASELRHQNQSMQNPRGSQPLVVLWAVLIVVLLIIFFLSHALRSPNEFQPTSPSDEPSFKLDSTLPTDDEATDIEVPDLWDSGVEQDRPGLSLDGLK